MSQSCIGIVYGFRKSKWIGYNTNELFAMLQASFSNSNFDTQKVGLLDTEVHIRNNRLKIYDAVTRQDLSELAGFYFANWRKHPEFALGLAELAKRTGKPVISEEVLQVVPMTKLGEHILLSDKGINLIDSVFMRSKYWLKRIDAGEELPFSFPFILKTIGGSRGGNNHLVRDIDQLRAILLEDVKRIFVAQEFIPNTFDYRIIIIGGKVRFAMKRQRQSEDTHLNNTSQGASAELMALKDLSGEVAELALQAAQATRRTSFAGVDIVQHSQTGEHYILEVNKTPQMETGAHTTDKVTALVDYFSEALGHAG